jgi:hypothetical protein
LGRVSVKEKASSRAWSMNGSPDAGILCRMFPFTDEESPSEGAPTCGGEGVRVTPLATSAWRLGRASEFVDGVLPPVELPRFNCGGPSSASGEADVAGGRDRDADVVVESPGVICALGVPSELPVARCSFGRSGSSLLLGEVAERLLDELLVVLSGLEFACRSLGLPWSPALDEPTGELLEELLVESWAKGRDVSFIACDAATCSSSVPSLTIVIVEAW